MLSCVYCLSCVLMGVDWHDKALQWQHRVGELELNLGTEAETADPEGDDCGSCLSPAKLKKSSKIS